jgi:hypothetical protein
MEDGGHPDASIDAQPGMDASLMDSAMLDSMMMDATMMDVAMMDAGEDVIDATMIDVMPPPIDGGPPDVMPPPMDAGPPDVLQPPDSGILCNNLMQGAPIVALNQSNQKPPAAQGGNVVTGLYYMTAFNYYNGQQGSLGNVQLTVDVAQSTMQVISTEMNITATGTSTWSTNNTTMTITNTCPSNNPPSLAGYTATKSEFRLYANDGMNNTIEEIFTHQ